MQRGGVKVHVRHFLVFVQRGEHGPQPRLGITVTRKVGSAVVRNRIKRLVREAFRRQRTRFRPGLDMVWVAKRNAADVSYDGVLADMRRLERRLGRGAEQEREPAG